MNRNAHGTAVLTPDVVTPDSGRFDDPLAMVRLVRQAWLAGFSDATAANYGWSIDRWFEWLADGGVHPFDAQRAMLEAFGKEVTTRSWS
jgi:hypothetical protein